MQTFTETSYAPINRSAYRLAAEATDAYEGARAKVAGFVNARDADEIVFTKNATEALNLVAQSWGGAHLAAGDVVVVTEMEHHANVVPWHIMAARQGIELRWLPITPDGQLDLTDLERLLDGAKVFAFTAMSNVLGTLTPVAELSAAAHAAGALSVVDACQYVPHNVTDVQAWDADFVAFSAHKMCGPSGIGALWGRAELLDDTPPFLGGGNMIADVRFDGYTPAPVPAKFEAGTPPIVEAIGFGAAVDFMQGVGMERIHTHERALTEYAMTTLLDRFGDDITLHGPTQRRVARRRAQLRLPRPAPARRVAGARPAQCVRARRPSLRQAADARARCCRDRAGELVSVQRPRRHRRPRRGARRRVGHLRFLVTERERMPGLEDLYREIILDHYRSPRNRGELPTPPAAVAQGHNPLCGDEITVYLLVDDDRVDDVKVGGQGCSISQSSASMMSQAIKGRSVDEVRALVRRFKGMMSIEDAAGDEGDGDGDGASSRTRRPRSAAGRRQVPGADQVRHVGVEHADRRPRRSRARRPAGLSHSVARPPGGRRSTAAASCRPSSPSWRSACPSATCRSSWCCASGVTCQPSWLLLARKGCAPRASRTGRVVG